MALYSACDTNHYIATGNAMVATTIASDWSNISSSSRPLITDWNSTSMDAQLRPHYSQLTVPMITLANLSAA